MKAIKYIKVLFFLLIITSLLIGCVFYYSNEKNKSRIYLNAENIIISEVKKEKHSKKKTKLAEKREIEDLNSSIKEVTGSIDEEELKRIKHKMELTNQYSNLILNEWEKPLNYEKGSSCMIDLYYKKNDIKYRIYECSSNEIFKRSIELSILSNIDKNKFLEINKFKYKDRINILFTPNSG